MTRGRLRHGRLPGGRDVRIAVLIAIILAVVVGVTLSRPRSEAPLAGHADRVFGPAPSTPTAREGQSRLWFADAAWWGILYERTTGTFRIARLDRARRHWIDTGVVVDERDSSQADAIWDGRHLHVVSAGANPSEPRHAARVLRYSYDATSQEYTLDPGYPVEITSGGVRSLGLARDSEGLLWVTYTEGRRVKVAHSRAGSREWTRPYDLPVAGAAGMLDQDQSAIVAFDNKVGIMWSDQTPGAAAYRFAVHRDGDPSRLWQAAVAHQGTKQVDNHMFLVGLPPSDPAGEVLALVKTSLTEPADPLYYLLARAADGSWSTHIVWRAADNASRARLAVDLAARKVLVYSVAPCCSGGIVSYKETDLDRISFPPGRGRLFNGGAGVRANNPTSTRQFVTKASGHVVLAADEEHSRYLFNSIGSEDRRAGSTR